MSVEFAGSPSIALVGSPNSGKTTLFNALTGSRQKTGNYAGVTVEKKEGLVHLGEGLELRLLDLPGAYSLDARTPDEAITAEVVQGLRNDERGPQAIIAVADTTNLERNLYLVLQLREMGLPMVLALTMSDLAARRGIQIQREELERRLGVPVVLTSAVKGSGLKELVKKVQLLLSAREPGERSSQAKGLSLDNSSSRILSRYQEIEDTLKAVVSRKSSARELTASIDKIVLHRIWGPLLLVLCLALMFQLIFTVARIPMDALDHGVNLLRQLLSAKLPDGQLRSLLIDGVLAGVGSVIVFLPQILILFAFIFFFEDSGYLARAAFILDRLMSKVGLHGRAFIPLLSSFACAIPGIMATRTIEHRRDRLITILVSPLMTCSARIPIYSLIISAFIPARPVFGFFTLQGLSMLGLYGLGVVMAMLVAFILQKTLLRGEKAGFVLELPTYKLPSLRNIILGMWDRSRIFLRRAGTVILSISVALWFLASYPRVSPPSGLGEKEAAAFQLEHSFAGHAGKWMEPAIRPLGFDWKIGVALLSSFAAREVVLSTLGTIYSIGYDKENSGKLGQTLTQQKQYSLATAVSLLVFYALACQCMSTLAVTRRETNSWRWPAFMFAYMTSLAYLAAFLAYRLVTILA